MAITVIIIIFLTFNLAFLHRQSEDGFQPPQLSFLTLVTRRLHYVQREFMMQTLVFFLFIGIAALIFCKVEGHTYVDGIYYMVVTTLTIGFGDITPNTACMKVLTFPFTIVGITLLALIVTSIVRLLADRARRRKLELKKRLKKKVSEKKRIHAGYGSKLTPWAQKRSKGGDGPRLKRSLTLQEELDRLREDDWKRERRSNLKSMALGFSVFLIFWFIGALIFDFVEVYRSQDAKLILAMGIRQRALLLLYVRFLNNFL
jgi:potassium channel subfamily K, other eukaryote